MTWGRTRAFMRLLLSSNSRLGMGFQVFIGLLVLAMCAIFVIETTDISPETLNTLETIETIITIIFALEYVCRWAMHHFSLRYPFNPLAIIDLIAILPLFISSAHFQFVRVLRLFRVLRLLRMLRSKGLVGEWLTEIHLRVVRILFILGSLVFVAAGLIYDIEHGHNPAIEHFFDATYFAVVTMTTVGFGDVVPLSHAGRVVTLLMITTGVLLIPWQLASLAQAIVLTASKRHVECKRCGLTYHEPDAVHCKMCGASIYQKYEGTQVR